MADFHPIAISHPVGDLVGARDFLVEALGLPLVEWGARWALLDNGTLAVRLLEASAAPAAPLQIELTTGNVAETADALELRPEVSSRSEEIWRSPDRCEVHLEVQGWLRLIVFRAYDEDEMNVVPELPTTMRWSSDADATLRALLRRVPLPFRQRARDRSTETAERVSSAQRLDEVGLSIAVEALAEVTPNVQHGVLRAALVELEVPQDLWSDFIRGSGAKRSDTATQEASTGAYPDKTCEIDSLVTHARFVQAALMGRKTQQRRDGLYAYPGETFELDGVGFKVTEVERQRLGDVSEDDARQEGFADLAAYRDLISRMHGGMPWDEDTLVWVHCFERVAAPGQEV